jgi:hypothetical protein
LPCRRTAHSARARAPLGRRAPLRLSCRGLSSSYWGEGCRTPNDWPLTGGTCSEGRHWRAVIVTSGAAVGSFQSGTTHRCRHDANVLHRDRPPQALPHRRHTRPRRRPRPTPGPVPPRPSRAAPPPSQGAGEGAPPPPRTGRQRAALAEGAGGGEGRRVLDPPGGRRRRPVPLRPRLLQLLPGGAPRRELGRAEAAQAEPRRKPLPQARFQPRRRPGDSSATRRSGRGTRARRGRSPAWWPARSWRRSSPGSCTTS